VDALDEMPRPEERLELALTDRRAAQFARRPARLPRASAPGGPASGGEPRGRRQNRLTLAASSGSNHNGCVVYWLGDRKKSDCVTAFRAVVHTRFHLTYPVPYGRFQPPESGWEQDT